LPACLAVLGVLGVALLPSEPVHSRTENGQHSEFIHRHFEPHHPVGSNPGVGHGEDNEARWVDSRFITPTSGAHVYPVSELLHEDLWVIQSAQTACGAVLCAPEFVHDPPWTTSHGLRVSTAAPTSY
jgi:hypothetical protein